MDDTLYHSFVSNFPLAWSLFQYTPRSVTFNAISCYYNPLGCTCHCLRPVFLISACVELKGSLLSSDTHPAQTRSYVGIHWHWVISNTFEVYDDCYYYKMHLQLRSLCFVNTCLYVTFRRFHVEPLHNNWMVQSSIGKGLNPLLCQIILSWIKTIIDEAQVRSYVAT